MAIEKGTNSYVTEAELTTYTTDRGITLSGTKAVLLIKAMDWLEIQPFRGIKAVLTQALQFPRILSDITLFEWLSVQDLWADGLTVPADIKKAQMVAACLIDTGASLIGAVDRAVKIESIAGAVSVEYMPGASEKTRYPELSLLLNNYLASPGGSFVVIRG